MENDTSFVFLAHLMPDILHFMFFKMAGSGHLGFRGKMVSKLYNNNLSRFVTPDLLKVDTFCTSSTFGATEI